MNNNILNKQITIETIIRVTDYLEEYKNEYEEKFLKDEEKNKDLPYNEKEYEYKNGSIKMKYTIDFLNGKNITESNLNWFLENINKSDMIKNISIDLYISYYTNNDGNNIDDIYNKISVSLYFRQNDANIIVDTTNQENEAHNVYSYIVNILENNEDRYNKTIKNRNIRIQSFCISVGIILSYILYIILKINVNSLPSIILNSIDNKYVLIFGQWIISIVLGNILSSWYILSIYKPLLPEKKYVGYNTSNYKSIYKDDVDEYIGHSEVQIGLFADAKNRRNNIERIFKITNKLILAQLIISIVMYLILK